MGKVLLVDDEPAVLFMLREVLADRGHEPITAASGREALAKLESADAVVTDLAMPGMSGLELLAAIRERDASLPVVLLTAHGSEKVAVSAMKAGAYDYATKPFDIDELVIVVERALEARGLRVATRRLAAEHAIGKRIIGESAAMRRLLDAVARVADKDVTVLVRGETGSGKEMVGSLLHAQSRRAQRPLVRFNCAAIPGDLAEAELFGHAKGAFTGAVLARRGFFAEADGGTLVLDEVGELPMGVQAKLLRAIQEGEIQPVGSGRVDRVDDIPALAEEFTRRYADKFGLGRVRLSPALLARLRTSAWPGNVRQLENTVARLVAMSSSPQIELEALLGGEPEPSPLASTEGAATPELIEGLTLREQVEAFERGLISRALEASHGNQSEAARKLGTSRVTLIDKIKKYRLGGEGTGGS